MCHESVPTGASWIPTEVPRKSEFRRAGQRSARSLISALPLRPGDSKEADSLPPEGVSLLDGATEPILGPVREGVRGVVEHLSNDVATQLPIRGALGLYERGHPFLIEEHVIDMPATSAADGVLGLPPRGSPAASAADRPGASARHRGGRDGPPGSVGVRAPRSRGLPPIEQGSGRDEERSPPALRPPRQCSDLCPSDSRA